MRKYTASHEIHVNLQSQDHDFGVFQQVFGSKMAEINNYSKPQKQVRNVGFYNLTPISVPDTTLPPRNDYPFPLDFHRILSTHKPYRLSSQSLQILAYSFRMNGAASLQPKKLEETSLERWQEFYTTHPLACLLPLYTVPVAVCLGQ